MNGIYNIKSSSLHDFESQRNSLLPVLNSTSFFSLYELLSYDVNENGEKINLVYGNEIGKFSIDDECIISDEDNSISSHIFYTKLRSGKIYVGEKGFSFLNRRSSTSSDSIYSGLELFRDAILIVDGPLHLDGEVNIHGNVEVNNKITFLGSTIYFHDDSVIKFDKELEDLSTVFSGEGSKVFIDGTIIIPINCIDELYSYDWINIADSATIIPIYDSEDNRTLSMTRYNDMLAESGVTIRTQSDVFSTKGKLGYKWLSGDTSVGYEVIALRSLSGENIFGDYKLQVLGTPPNVLANRHIVSEVIVEEDSILYISDIFNGSDYNYPVMHVGSLGEDVGKCIIYGSLICNYGGSDRFKDVITLDNGGTLIIEENAHLILTNGSRIKSSNGKMVINGTVEIDAIEQIASFEQTQIIFGEKGKLIIKNTSYPEGTVLWTTPNGIKDTELYRLFYPDGNLKFVEYHIPAGLLVGIDKYVGRYDDIPSFYNDLRFENAVHKGFIIWEDGAGLQLKSTYLSPDGTTWINSNTTLYDIAMIFKNTGATPKECLQEVVNHLKYAGFGNIHFVIDDRDPIILRLKSPEIRTISRDKNGDYIVENYYKGTLILNNELPNANVETILNNPKKMISLDHDPETEGKTTNQNVFSL